MDHDKIFIDDRFHQPDAVIDLVKKFADFQASDLSRIITRYISYEPEAVSAALYLSVEKGLITYELKELLWSQIESNFNAHYRHIKSYSWEKNNAFLKYVSGYTDDEIYDIIDNPKDIMTDVFFAILTLAKDRELISDNDFKNYCMAAKSGTIIERQSGFREIKGLSSYEDPENLFENKEEMEAEKEKFWKCPKCNKLVEMEFGVCWNCEAEAPSVVEHPDNAEIIEDRKEAISESSRMGNPIRSGFFIAVFGTAMALFEHYRTFYSRFAIQTRFMAVGFGIFIAFLGIIILGYGIYIKFKKDDF
jgi:hypothetical protein